MFLKIYKTTSITNTNNAKNDLRNNNTKNILVKFGNDLLSKSEFATPLMITMYSLSFAFWAILTQSVGTTKARIWYHGTGGWCQQGIQILIRCCLHWRCWWWVPWWHGIQIRPFLPHWACPMCWRRGRRGANRDPTHWTLNTEHTDCNTQLNTTHAEQIGIQDAASTSAKNATTLQLSTFPTHKLGHHVLNRQQHSYSHQRYFEVIVAKWWYWLYICVVYYFLSNKCLSGCGLSAQVPQAPKKCGVDKLMRVSEVSPWTHLSEHCLQWLSFLSLKQCSVEILLWAEIFRTLDAVDSLNFEIRICEFLLWKLFLRLKELLFYEPSATLRTSAPKQMQISFLPH